MFFMYKKDYKSNRKRTLLHSLYVTVWWVSLRFLCWTLSFLKSFVVNLTVNSTVLICAVGVKQYVTLLREHVVPALQ